jgi:hypothetical protein
LIAPLVGCVRRLMLIVLKTAGALAPFVDRQFADTVPLGYGQLTSPHDQIASVARGRAGTNFNHIPDGTVSIR